MSRVRRRPRAELDDDERRLFDLVADGERARRDPELRRTGDDGALEGPFNAMLLSPRLGTAVQDVGVAVRYGSHLTDRCRELATLAVAERWDSAYERHAHLGLARKAGLTDAEIGGDLTDPVERAVLAATHALLGGDLDDPTYAEIVDAVGERGVFELTVLVGHYAALALQLRVFRVEP